MRIVEISERCKTNLRLRRTNAEKPVKVGIEFRICSLTSEFFAAGDVQDFAGNEIGIQQEVDGIDKFLRRACSTKRNRRDRALFVPVVSIFRRQNSAWSDAIHLDQRSQLQRERFSNATQSRFCGGVNEMAGARPLGAPVEDVHDVTSLTFSQLTNELLCQKNGSQQINRKMDIAMIQIDPRQRSILKHGRTVDQCGDFAKFRSGFENFCRCCSRIAEVGRDSDSSAALSSNSIHQHVGFDGRSAMMDHHRKASCGHRQCDLTSDSASSTRYNRDVLIRRTTHARRKIGRWF